MSVTSIQDRRADRSGRASATRVVAVVLEDGTVRPVEDVPNASSSGEAWARGRLSGPDWVLWWERRAWDEPGA